MLQFDIDVGKLRTVADDLGASEKQYRAAFSRACTRTAATLRKMSARGLRDELKLRTLGILRRRLKSIRIKGKNGGVALWYGLNDIPVSSFKGTVRQDSGGAWAQDFYHEGGFVGRSKFGKKKTIFKRSGRGRLPIREQLQHVKDQADIYVEDEIFVEVERVFWRHFVRDLEARVKYDIKSEVW